MRINDTKKCLKIYPFLTKNLFVIKFAFFSNRYESVIIWQQSNIIWANPFNVVKLAIKTLFKPPFLKGPSFTLIHPFMRSLFLSCLKSVASMLGNVRVVNPGYWAVTVFSSPDRKPVQFFLIDRVCIRYMCRVRFQFSTHTADKSMFLRSWYFISSVWILCFLSLFMYLLIFDSVFLEFYYCGHSIYMDFTSFFFHF